jgi:cytochrome c peroxidase
MAFADSRVFVAEYFSDTVAEVDLGTGGPPAVRSIVLGSKPNLSQQRRGEMLFHDATICYQQWQSCASCHPDGRVDALNWDLLNDGVGNPKNTKSLLLAHQTPPSMAEGVRGTAESAVRSGLVNILFADRPDEEAAAMDVFLQSLEPIPSPHLVDGRLSAAAERGRLLFESPQVGCQRCHPAPLYTDLRSHDVGTRTPIAQNARFDTPTLIEVWRTAPYLHDGRYTTIKQLLVEGRHGLRGGGGGKALSKEQLDDLVQFVLSL